MNDGVLVAVVVPIVLAAFAYLQNRGNKKSDARIAALESARLAAADVARAETDQSTLKAAGDQAGLETFKESVKELRARLAEMGEQVDSLKNQQAAQVAENQALRADTAAKDSHIEALRSELARLKAFLIRQGFNPDEVTG